MELSQREVRKSSWNPSIENAPADPLRRGVCVCGPQVPVALVIFSGATVLSALPGGRLLFFRQNGTIVPMNIVADSSIFLAVALEEPERERIIRLTEGHELIAPEILPFELGNALSALFRRSRIRADEVLVIWDIINKVPVELKPVEIRTALQLVSEHDIYAYDACFLECARHWRSPLLTLDRGMSSIAVKENIQVLEV